MSFVKRLLGNIVFIFYVREIMMSFGMSSSPRRVRFFFCVFALYGFCCFVYIVYTFLIQFPFTYQKKKKKFSRSHTSYSDLMVLDC